MFSNLNHVGLNITRNKLQLVEVVREASKFCLENVNEHIFDDEFDFNSEESEIISILQASLNSLTGETPLKSKNISVSLPLNEFKVFEIPFETSLSPSALDEHVKWEFSILFPMLKSEDYIIRFTKLTGRNKEKKLLVVGLSSKLVKSIHKFCVANKLNLKYIDNSHFAFNSTLRISESQNILSIYLCSVCCSINSYLGKKLHTVKQTEVIDNKSLINFVNEFIENQNIAYDKIFLSSSLDVDELRLGLETELQISVELVNPFDSIQTSKSFIQNAYFLNAPNLFAAAAGICYRKL